MSHYIEIETCTVESCLEALLSVEAGVYVIAPAPQALVAKFTMKLRYHVFKHGYKLKSRKEGRKLRLWLTAMTPIERQRPISNWKLNEDAP